MSCTPTTVEWFIRSSNTYEGWHISATHTNGDYTDEYELKKVTDPREHWGLIRKGAIVKHFDVSTPAIPLLGEALAYINNHEVPRC